MDAVQSILSKAPPADLGKNLMVLHNTVFQDNPDATEALTKKYELPFCVQKKVKDGDKPFLLCRYNRQQQDQQQQQQHRSPWTNRLYPSKKLLQDDKDNNNNNLRSLELSLNEVWDAYKNLYYGHDEDTVGSVYLWSSSSSSSKKKSAIADVTSSAFQGFFGIHKTCLDGAGLWDSIHIVHVDQVDDENETCHYRVESSVLMVIRNNSSNNKDQKDLHTASSSSSSYDLSASLSKETSKTCPVQPAILDACHIENIGTLIEANEIDLRSSLERVHIPKTQEILTSLQKEPVKKMRPQVNPLMGMIMGSDVLKKKKLQDSS